MDEDSLRRLTYLILLGGVILGSVLISNRRNLGTLLRNASLWALIFLGAIVTYGLWGDIRSTVVRDQALWVSQDQVSLRRYRDGHFYAILHVNEKPVRFIVDTGASDMVLSERDAKAVGINLEDLVFFGRAQTANGEVRTAPVSIDRIRLGERTFRNVRASVNGGELDISLLGNSFLNRLAKIEISGNTMVLTF